MIGIYRIVNKIDGKCYVGKSYNISKRVSDHFVALRNGLHKNKSGYDDKLQNAYNKYGEDCFYWEVLTECEKSELSDLEKYWIKYYDSNLNGYNQTKGGEGGDTYSYRSKEEKEITKNKKSKSNSNRKVINNGSEEKRVPIEEYDMYISNGWTDGMSEDHKNHLKENHKGFLGKKKTEEHNNKLRERFKGIPLSEEHRKKLSESHKGYVMPEEQKKKLSESSKGRIKVNNGVTLKCIYPEELPSYIENGFEIGWGELVEISNGEKTRKVYRASLKNYINKGYFEV